MKITLNQQEIEAAVRAHVLNQISIKNPDDIKIGFTATRGEEGIVANIDIPYIGLSGLGNIADTTTQAAPAPVTAAAPTAAKTAKAAAKPVAKETKPFANLQTPQDPAQNAGAEAQQETATDTSGDAATDAPPFATEGGNAEGEPAAAEPVSNNQKKSLFDFGTNR